MKEITICDEYIKLGQALKLAGIVGAGTDAKFIILSGQVRVNGEVEVQRGKKLRPGDIFSYKNEEVTVKSK